MQMGKRVAKNLSWALGGAIAFLVNIAVFSNKNK